MSIEVIIGNIKFNHPEPGEFDPQLAGNEHATLHIYSVTFDSMVLSIAPPLNEWSRTDIYTVIRSFMPLIYCLAKVEIYLGIDQIGSTLTTSPKNGNRIFPNRC